MGEVERFKGKMTATELAQLHKLLNRYQQTHDTSDAIQGIIEGIEKEFESTPKKKNQTITNPRGAGHSYIIPAERRRIIKLHEQGMSIRAIAQEMKCSTGTVHKVIHDQH